MSGKKPMPITCRHCGETGTALHENGKIICSICRRELPAAYVCSQVLRGLEKEIREYVQTVQDKRSESAADLLGQAGRMAEAGKYEYAENALLHLVDMEPKNHQARLMLSAVQMLQPALLHFSEEADAGYAELKNAGFEAGLGPGWERICQLNSGNASFDEEVLGSLQFAVFCRRFRQAVDNLVAAMYNVSASYAAFVVNMARQLYMAESAYLCLFMLFSIDCRSNFNTCDIYRKLNVFLTPMYNRVASAAFIRYYTVEAAREEMEGNDLFHDEFSDLLDEDPHVAQMDDEEKLEKAKEEFYSSMEEFRDLCGESGVPELEELISMEESQQFFQMLENGTLPDFLNEAVDMLIKAGIDSEDNRIPKLDTPPNRFFNMDLDSDESGDYDWNLWIRETEYRTGRNLCERAAFVYETEPGGKPNETALSRLQLRLLKSVALLENSLDEPTLLSARSDEELAFDLTVAAYSTRILDKYFPMGKNVYRTGESISLSRIREAREKEKFFRIYRDRVLDEKERRRKGRLT